MSFEHSQPADPTPEEWVTLHQASELLGVAASTVRRWADSGQLTTRRTLGGHRRFSRTALLKLAAEAHPPLAAAASAANPHAGWGVDTHKLARQEWHARLAKRADADRMRGLGQRLLGLLIQYINRREADARFLAEARAVGASYGREAREAGVTMHDTVEAFLFFRSSFAQLALPLPTMVQQYDLAESATLQARIDRFMDAILLGTIDGFETTPEA